MAKSEKHEKMDGQVTSEFVMEEGKWQYIESHIGTLNLVTTGKAKMSVPKGVLQNATQTVANPNGWRFWLRRAIPILRADQTVSEWLDELERFESADTIYFPEQLYVYNSLGDTMKIKEQRQKKNYKIFLDTQGNPISREQFHKNMVESAVVLASQKHMQVKLRNSAAVEALYDELNVDRPQAGERKARIAKTTTPVDVDASEGMDS
jgi:hypothetical protein